MISILNTRVRSLFRRFGDKCLFCFCIYRIGFIYIKYAKTGGKLNPAEPCSSDKRATPILIGQQVQNV